MGEHMRPVSILLSLRVFIYYFFYFTIQSLLRAMQPSSDQRMNTCPTGIHKTNAMEDGPSLGKHQWDHRAVEYFTECVQLLGSFSFHYIVDSFWQFCSFTLSIMHATIISPPHKFCSFSNISPLRISRELMVLKCLIWSY